VTRDAETAEASQLMPLAVALDLRDGKVVWSGAHLISPWRADGGLADLDGLPRLKAHHEQHAERLCARHQWPAPTRPLVPHDRPGRPEPGRRRKLLLPDLRHRVAPVMGTGGLCPHHNLYWITSDDWDLRVLGGLLLSDFATLFVETYSPRMAGGALRVTAQYLKRICLPEPAAVARDLAARLAAAFDARDVEAATRAAASAYRVDPAVPPCA
jgi:hypothetical protein